MLSEIVSQPTSIIPADPKPGLIYDYQTAERLRREKYVRSQIFLNEKYQVIRNPLDPRLYAPNKKIKDVTGVTTLELAKTLVGRHIIEGGLGLAAPQIGANVQMFAMTIPGTKNFVVIMNPRIALNDAEEANDDNTYWDVEGCISHEGIWLEIARLKKVTIYGQTIHHPKPRKYTFEGMAARVVQHEICHCLPDGGKLITDMPASCRRNLRTDPAGQERLFEENRKAEEFGFPEPEV
jgi:peptide deformylase